MKINNISVSSSNTGKIQNKPSSKGDQYSVKTVVKKAGEYGRTIIPPKVVKYGAAAFFTTLIGAVVYVASALMPGKTDTTGRVGEYNDVFAPKSSVSNEKGENESYKVPFYAYLPAKSRETLARAYSSLASESDKDNLIKNGEALVPTLKQIRTTGVPYMHTDIGQVVPKSNLPENILMYATYLANPQRLYTQEFDFDDYSNKSRNIKIAQDFLSGFAKTKVGNDPAINSNFVKYLSLNSSPRIAEALDKSYIRSIGSQFFTDKSELAARMREIAPQMIIPFEGTENRLHDSRTGMALSDMGYYTMDAVREAIASGICDVSYGPGIHIESPNDPRLEKFASPDDVLSEAEMNADIANLMDSHIKSYFAVLDDNNIDFKNIDLATHLLAFSLHYNMNIENAPKMLANMKLLSQDKNDPNYLALQHHVLSEFLDCVYSGNEVMRGLVMRRIAEFSMFQNGSALYPDVILAEYEKQHAPHEILQAEELADTVNRMLDNGYSREAVQILKNSVYTGD
ncbi:MAG: hypothetical protein ACI4CY_04635 [Candidatus Gastranaerophilaceae bacterium]